MTCFSKYLKKDTILSIDYNSKDLPLYVQFFKPTVYIEDKNTFCCILGPDPESGIFGCGLTPVEAMINWDLSYQSLCGIKPAVQEKYFKEAGLYDLWVSWKREEQA